MYEFTELYMNLTDTLLADTNYICIKNYVRNKQYFECYASYNIITTINNSYDTIS